MLALAGGAGAEPLPAPLAPPLGQQQQSTLVVQQPCDADGWSSPGWLTGALAAEQPAPAVAPPVDAPAPVAATTVDAVTDLEVELLAAAAAQLGSAAETSAGLVQQGVLGWATDGTVMSDVSQGDGSQAHHRCVYSNALTHQRQQDGGEGAYRGLQRQVGRAECGRHCVGHLAHTAPHSPLPHHTDTLNC